MKNTLLSIWLLFVTSHGLGQSYEVLFPFSYGKDAIDYSGVRSLRAMAHTVLVDGEIESTGTNAVTFDRQLMTNLRIISDFPINPKFAAKLVLSGLVVTRKEEGKDAPRIIRTQSWFETRPRLEFTYFSAANLEIFAGLNIHYISPFEAKFESIDITTIEDYSAVTAEYPHFGFLKRTAGIKGGFSYQLGADASRQVKKQNQGDSDVLEIEDVVQNPTTLTIFAEASLGTVVFFMEFAAIQAGDGGNRTDGGESVEEDYVKFSLFADIPVSAFSIHTKVIHKTLSYASNQNVSLIRIPQTSLFVDAQWPLGPAKLSAGLVFLHGDDGQSLEEFNANYKLWAVGASLGLQSNW